MADAKPPSTTDLLLLILGLEALKNPNAAAQTGDEYYLNPAKLTDERTMRDATWDLLFMLNPSLAWSKVKFRDWLITTLFSNITDHKHDFNAISEPVICSKDLLAKEYDRYAPGVTDAIKKALLAESGLERSFFSTLTFGISKQVTDGQEVFLFGAGFRRRAQLWLNDEEAIQADAEFYVPFFILPNHKHDATVLSASVRSICAGISVTNTKGHALGIHDGKELTGMRFNLRIPFKLAGDNNFQTDFGQPQVNIQRKIKDGLDWEKFAGWQKFLETYCQRPEIGDLLNSPMGPLLAEKISDGSGVTDLILKQSKRDEIKASLPQFKKDLDQTLDLLKNIWEWQPPDKDDPEPHSGSRKLGSLLHALGFMSSKPAGNGDFEYAFKLAANVTPWSVLNLLLDQLDGFPVYVGGLDSKTDKYNRIAVSLASQSDLADSKKHYFGIAGLAYNILLNPVSKEDDTPAKDDSDKPSIVLSDDYFSDDDDIFIDTDSDDDDEPNAPQNEQNNPPAKEKKSKVDVMLQLGKWFSNETLDDNWMLRLLPKTDEPGKQTLPLPGIRVLPFKRVESTDHTKANFSWTLLVDLLSVGIDIQGTTKEGLKFLQGVAGYFGLGAVEVRLTLKISFDELNTKKSFFDHVVFGVGVKLKDMRLSLGPKEEEEEKKGAGDEIIAGIQKALGDDWAVLPNTEPKERTVNTRLSAKKKDKFSLSIGYLSPLKDGGNSTLDIQLYDEKGNRGKMVLIPIDRGGPIYLKQIGIALKGVENVEIRKGLPDSAQLTVSLTGGIRLPVYELGFIGAKLTFQLNNPTKFDFGLDGLDVSLKIGPVIISGSFMKVGIEYAGSLTVSIPKGSFSAMGFYGSLLLFDFASETDTISKLNVGTIPAKLSAGLLKEKITPTTNLPIQRANGGGWNLYANDGKQYKIESYENKFIVLRPDKTFFIYVTLSAASGTGITVGPIQFTGIVFGYGYNRRAKIPTIENVADFPLVKIVMGQGGYQSEDDSFELHKQLAKPIEDPIAIFEKMKSHLVPELGQQFACGGVRFTIAGTIDCFALIIVQWGGGAIEISLLGLARFRLPRDTTARAICYIELQILMTLKPSEGTFKLQALLSNNSWIINSDCKLTGGFALFVWFGGEHKGDIVVTLGGYHPRFRRPDHYPVVPRLGLNWSVNDNLSIKGGIYLAYTPSCGMLGARLEAAFHSGRISAYFTAYLDVIINWDPPYFEAEIGISLRVEARFFVFSLSLTIAASIEMWGPPVGGIAHIDLTVIKFDIKFNDVPRQTKPELIKTWQQFCHKFLNLSGDDTRALKEPVAAFPMVQPNLAAGRNNLNTLPNARRQETQAKAEDEIWKVRADELELAATAAVPVTTMNFGKVKTNSPPEGVQQRSMSGRSLMVKEPVKLVSEGLATRKSANDVGAHAMGKGIKSVLNVTIVSDDISAVDAVDVTDWTIEEEVGNLPAAVWEPGEPNMQPKEPTAKLIEGCITGVKRLKPPRGKLGKKAAPPPLEWHVLEKGKVAQVTTAQKKPAGKGARNIQTLVVQKQSGQKDIVAALSSAGFTLSWQSLPQADVRMRELHTDPLAGAVA